MALLLLQAFFLRTLRAAAYLAYTIKAAGAARTHIESITSKRFYKTFMFLRGCSPVSIAVTYFDFTSPHWVDACESCLILGLTCFHACIMCCFAQPEMGSRYIAQADLKGLGSSNLPSSCRHTVHLARKEHGNNWGTPQIYSLSWIWGSLSEKFLKFWFLKNK